MYYCIMLLIFIVKKIVIIDKFVKSEYHTDGLKLSIWKQWLPQVPHKATMKLYIGRKYTCIVTMDKK